MVGEQGAGGAPTWPVTPVAQPERRGWARRLLAWWPLIPLLAGLGLIQEGRERYWEYVSVDSSDVVVLQLPDPRPRVVCGSDAHPGGVPGVVQDRCDRLMAERAPLTRQLFWGGVALVLVGTALIVRHVGIRTAWPFVALGAAVAGCYVLSWLMHLPLEGGLCASLWSPSESPYPEGSRCPGAVDLAGAAVFGLVLATVALGLAGSIALVRRAIHAVTDVRPV